MKTTRINPLVICLLALTLGFSSCEKNDDFQEFVIAESSESVSQARGVLSSSGESAIVHDVNYQCNLQVVFSDDETLVLYIEGTGFWEGYGTVDIKMSRIIDIASRSISGEGSINTESSGLMSFVVEGRDAWLPGEDVADGLDYLLNVSLGSDEFQFAAGQIQISTVLNPDNPYQESISAFGTLNLE